MRCECRQVKDQAAEDKLPSFDLGKKAGQKIRLQTHRRAIILCVVDVADFDGSLPRTALSALLTTIGYGDEAPTDVPRDVPHQLLIAVNKIDLLPTQISVKRLEVCPCPVIHAAKVSSMLRLACIDLSDHPCAWHNACKVLQREGFPRQLAVPCSELKALCHIVSKRNAQITALICTRRKDEHAGQQACDA